MKIHVDDKFLAIQFDTEEEQKQTFCFFTYSDESMVFTGGSYNKNRIKKVQFLKKQKNWYLTNSGFLRELLYFCKNNSFKVSLFDDKRTKFEHQKKDFSNEEISSYFPFDYNEHQVRVMKKLLKISCGVAQLPTSAGKGDIIISFIKIVKLPTLLLVNKVMLCKQLYDRIKKSGIDNVGICIGEGVKNIDADVVVSTIGSVRKLNLERFKCIIGDEIHNFSAKTFQDFLNITSYPIKIGFSATPNKGDKYKWALIRQFFGDVEYEVNSEELIQNKVMAKPIIYFIKNYCNNLPDYQVSYIEEIIKSEKRNKIILEIVERFNLPTLILLQDVVNGQGEYLKNEIEKMNKRVSFIHGAIKDRDNHIENLESGEIDVLISTGILNEGVSIKNIKLLINASGMKSFSTTAQKIGRSLRIKDGKTTAAIIDFVDEGNKFLEKHGRRRVEIFQKLGYCDIVKINLEDLLKYDEKSIVREN